MKKLVLLLVLSLILPDTFAGSSLSKWDDFYAYVNNDHDNQCVFTASINGGPKYVTVMLTVASNNEIFVDNLPATFHHLTQISTYIYFEYYNVTVGTVTYGVEISRNTSNTELYHVTIRDYPH